MKFKSDYTTSSSSFVISLKKKPESIAEFYNMVYGDQKHGDISLLQRLFNDMPKNGMTRDELISEFIEEDWNYIKNGFNDMSWEEMLEYQKIIGKEEAESFLIGKEGNFIFSLEYEDCDGNMEGRLRESSVLDNVDHKRFSHH